MSSSGALQLIVKFTCSASGVFVGVCEELGLKESCRQNFVDLKLPREFFLSLLVSKAVRDG